MEDSEDRIEMWHYPTGLTGRQETDLKIGMGGEVPEVAIPGRYNLLALRAHFREPRRPPMDFEPPKVGILITDERVEKPQLREFDFE